MSEQHAAGAQRPAKPHVDAALSADPEVVSRFVEAFASQLVEAGMARMPARVFAALLASDDGVLTSAQLSERLRVSPAAVSGAVRYLGQVNMVSREREPGSRRERYRVYADQWYEALTNRDAVMKRWAVTLREGITAMGPDTLPGRRMSETLEFFSFLEDELADLMDRWRVHRDKLAAEGAWEREPPHRASRSDPEDTA
ncbi:GbsR/MarR family transcriptional regulator [Streptomyces sp. NPDC058045]|uniref:GbsR/MarR family transcriptional regulator n=1 Tax=Streptomyces sp. NPDC058045 TaxID=3346311 RepID=UPI0036EE2DAE